MALGYIRVKTQGVSSENGYILQVNIINSLTFSKGVQTVDFTLPTASAQGRLLTPISGLKEDYVLDLEIIDDGNNKAFSVDSIGNLTGLSKITTKQQIDFLMQTFMVGDLNAVYSFADQWLVDTDLAENEIVGHMTLTGEADEEDFFTSVKVRCEFKVGKNIFSLF